MDKQEFQKTWAKIIAKAWSDPEKQAAMLSKIPLGRFNEPIDVANAVILLLSDQAEMLNGIIVPVDGGFMAKG